MAVPAQPAIAVVTAAGKASFTGQQIDRLQRAGEATFHQAAGELGADALGQLLQGATVAGLNPRAVPRLGPAEIAALPSSLTGIAAFATGVDFVDVAALQARGIALRHLPGYSTITVAEHTVGLLLLTSRRLHLSRDRAMGRVDATTSVRGWELCGRTLGLVGLGRIGRRVASLAQGLGMEVIGADRSRQPPDGVTPGDLADVLGRADVVSLHTSTSWGAGPVLGAGELARMRRGAHLINATRASLVDEAAVVEAIAAGQLAGYAVDDRLGDAVRPRAERLLREGRIVETGHTAWYSQEALDRGTEAWVDRIVALASEQARRGDTPAGGQQPHRDRRGGRPMRRVAGR